MKNNVGKNNPRWNGGNSQGYQIRIYRGILQDKGVDLNYCEKCGKHKAEVKRMCVHHIDNNHKNNHPNNLINLCSPCHGMIHLGKKKLKLICKFCKEEFYVIPSSKHRIYGSSKCSNRYHNERRKGINDHRFKDCIICGKTFSFFPSRLKKGIPKFCSQKCHYEFNKKDGKRWHKKMLNLRRIKNGI